MSKTTSDYLGLTLRDNNEFVDTEVDAENFRKIDGELQTLSAKEVTKATCTAEYSAADGCFIHSVTRGDRKSNVLLFTPARILTSKDIVRLDGNDVAVKSLLSGNAMPYKCFWPGVTTLAFFDAPNNTLYVKPSNPVLDGRYETNYRFGKLVITDSKTGEEKRFTCDPTVPTFETTLEDGVSYVGTGIQFQKFDGIVWALGVLNVSYSGEKKTILSITEQDGTAENIALNHLGVNDHFLSACNGYKIARLEWKNASDGNSVLLILHYIWDLATGKQAANGTYEVSVDSHYYSGE